MASHNAAAAASRPPECSSLRAPLMPSVLSPLLRSLLLWRRSDNIVFALLLGGADKVVVGDGVECKVKGILQVGEREGRLWE